MQAITCVGSGEPALDVIISSETAPGRVFRLSNHISSFTSFVVLLLHKSEKAEFVVQPDFFLSSFSLQASKRFPASHSSTQVFQGCQKARSFPSATTNPDCNRATAFRSYATQRLTPLIYQKHTFILVSDTVTDSVYFPH